MTHYNMHINIAAATAMSNLMVPDASVCGGGTTLHTPEILNTVIAIESSPFDRYPTDSHVSRNDSSGVHSKKQGVDRNSNSYTPLQCTRGGGDSNCSTTTTGSRLRLKSNGSPPPLHGHGNAAARPIASPPMMSCSMNTVQQTCSQLIKAGLKVTLEQKLKKQQQQQQQHKPPPHQQQQQLPVATTTTTPTSNNNDPISSLFELRPRAGSDASAVSQSYSTGTADYYGPSAKRMRRSDASEESDDDKHSSGVGLTPEDEERRQRRRERNKIAATKCRLKKRERTNNLQTESEHLDRQNVELKTQKEQLLREARHLRDVLQAHRLTCPHHIPPASTEELFSPNANGAQSQQSHHSQTHFSHSPGSSNNCVTTENGAAVGSGSGGASGIFLMNNGNSFLPSGHHSRPASADSVDFYSSSAHLQMDAQLNSCPMGNRPTLQQHSMTSSFCGSTNSNYDHHRLEATPHHVIIEEDDELAPQFTDLDQHHYLGASNASGSFHGLNNDGCMA